MGCNKMKKFNVTGVCIPEKDYMVDTTPKLNQIIRMIENNEYFTINRARQYGKTTTFASLYRRLKEKYTVIRMSFEGVGEEAFSSNIAFVRFFVNKVADFLDILGEKDEVIAEWRSFENYEKTQDAFDYLGKKITTLCKSNEKEIIVCIDEVDKSSDNQIFLNFLGMLRDKYLSTREGLDFTFKSVILAGIYDIKNLKLKLRPDAEKRYNSPWNIAADFNVDMSFSAVEIATMLQEYENDFHTGMDIEAISEELYFYTSGYPFLVSRLCKWIDEEGDKIWNLKNVKQAVNAVLRSDNTLFDDLIKNVENDPDLKRILRDILLNGLEVPFVKSNEIVKKGVMFGILSEKDNYTKVSNIIFETYLYNHFLMEKLLETPGLANKNSEYVEHGKLNMPYILKKFQELMHTEYRSQDEKFIERQGRLLFLCFLKPIINGTGFYYVEPETRNNTRMDLVVAYGNEEYIIELKIWHGGQYRAKGIKQLEDYIDSRNVENGYLISFSFLKSKQSVCRWLDDAETRKKIFEVVI